MDAAALGELTAALRSSQRLGMLGARPIGEVIDHSHAFVGALRSVTGVVLDLGAGGGVPGLVIAIARPDLRVVLVDRRTRRTDQLRLLTARLGVTDRVEVISSDASSLASARSGHASAVVARSFGPPVRTLSVAAPLVAPGGLVVISEPPPTNVAGAERWPEDVLAELRLARRPSDPRVAVFQRAAVPRET